MKNNIISKFLFFLCAFFGLAFIMSVLYINRNFAFIDTNPLAQILFHFIVQIDGADPELIKGMVLQIIVIPLVLSIIAYIILFSNNKYVVKLQDIRVISIIKKWSLLLSLLFFIISTCLICKKIELIDYINTYTKSSTLYEDDYVDPASVEYLFPEKKRNLIYIFLESVESSFFSEKEGGICQTNLIPELYNIASDNITFNNKKGFYVAPNTGWTVGAMVGQSAGIPLSTPIGENEFITDNKFLPGAYSLGDLLEDNGYHNVLLLGSEAVFGGRKYYYEKHGNYELHDYTYALENSLVTEDQFVWWGYEDYKLFEFAKKDLIELSNDDEPFNLTMLTVDTHNPDGYRCDYCKYEHNNQLADAYSCSSRLVDDFIEWCKQQDFYENTTIVVVGDHCSMSESINEMLTGTDRTVYFTIINSAKDASEDIDRICCTYDIYPTTVSSLGINIEGDRLALGTDLFSKTETLCEKYGKEVFFNYASLNSTYYINHILYGFD